MQPRCEEYRPGNSYNNWSPWSIGDIGILDNNQLANGPGRSYKQQASSLTVIVGYGRIKSPLATGIGITANGQKQKGKQ